MTTFPFEQDAGHRCHATRVSQLAAMQANWLAGALVRESVGSGCSTRDDESREARIRRSAYLKAQRRAFAQGHDVEDWLEAEREVDAATGR